MVRFFELVNEYPGSDELGSQYILRENSNIGEKYLDNTVLIRKEFLENSEFFEEINFLINELCFINKNLDLFKINSNTNLGRIQSIERNGKIKIANTTCNLNIIINFLKLV
jgi:hypothetical protein